MARDATTSASGPEREAASSSKKNKVKYYGVRKGRKPGVYLTWNECRENIWEFKSASYKSFPSRAEAEAFVDGRSTTASASASNSTTFYGVAVGKVPGVYTNWDDAQEQIVGWKGPKYKKFESRAEAEAFVSSGGGLPSNLVPSAKRKAQALVDAPTPERSSNGSDSTEHTSKKSKKDDDYREGNLHPPINVKDNKLVIYTDGSSLGNGKKNAVAGVGVFFGFGDKRNVSEALQGTEQTNQRAELTAVLRALQIAPTKAEVHIYTDSRYSISCVTVWYQSWLKNGWQTSQQKPVTNKDLIQAILARINEREAVGGKTFFNWIKGHSDDPSNVAADRLAVNAAERERVR